MLQKLTHLCLLLILGILFSTAAMANGAGLLLSPTRIILEDGNRYSTMIVRNNGDATGRYKIELVDTIMQENGGIRIREDGSKDEFTAMDMISMSPRSITLKPDENQSVRILIKYRHDIPDGEYRSHILVKMMDTGFDPASIQAKPEGAGIVIQTKISTVIPVIIRVGKTSYNCTIDEAALVMGGGDNKKVPEVKVNMSFSGNRSVVGDFKIVHVANDKTETQLAFYRGVVIYRGVAKRNQTVPLTVPQGIDIQKGQLRIDFLTQENEGSHVISEKVITP